MLVYVVIYPNMSFKKSESFNIVGDLRLRDSNVTPSIKDRHIEVIIETILLLACHSYQSR